MRKLIFILILSIIFVNSCKIVSFNGSSQEKDGIIFGHVYATFSKKTLSGINVVVENAPGGQLSAITDSSGNYEINIGSAGTYTITYNWERERVGYVPRKIEGYAVYGRTEISIDLAEEKVLIAGKKPLGAVLGAKRGGGAGYSCGSGHYLPNYKWVDHPKHYYYNQQIRENPTVWKYYLRIMLKDMPKYTGGFLHPKYEDLEPVPSQKGLGMMIVYFDTDVIVGYGGLNGNEIKDKKIIASFASAAGGYWNMKSEILDSVYYGDEESSLGPDYDSKWDEDWGDFNWKYRANINYMTCDSVGLREKDVFGTSSGALYTTVAEYSNDIFLSPFSETRRTDEEIILEDMKNKQRKIISIYNWRVKK